MSLGSRSSHCHTITFSTRKTPPLTKSAHSAGHLLNKSNFRFRYPSSFNAFFMPGSDPELTVFPQVGDMLPQGTEGTKISVAFTPKMYGRGYKGKLIVQVSRNRHSFICTRIPGRIGAAGTIFVSADPKVYVNIEEYSSDDATVVFIRMSTFCKLAIRLSILAAF